MVLKTRAKSTKIVWHVSGRRYASSAAGPMPTRNIILKRLTPPNSPLQFGQRKLCFFIKALISSSDILSGTFSPVFSVIWRSARKVEPHFVHFTIGSVKLPIWPDEIGRASYRERV